MIYEKEITNLLHDGCRVEFEMSSHIMMCCIIWSPINKEDYSLGHRGYGQIPDSAFGNALYAYHNGLHRYGIGEKEEV